MPNPKSAPRWLTGAAGAVALTATALLVGSAQVPATAAATPEVFAGFDDSSHISTVVQIVQKLHVPAGSYAVTAKAFVVNNTTTTANVDCQLKGDALRDRTSVRVTANGGIDSIAMNAVFALTGQDLVITCQSTSDVELNWLKIVATRVNGLSDVAI